ncbi:hypothetical protein HUS23_01690 [Ectothiorhodospiraceae bacterium 2226]|nr:hypothetical protein HUS23_01690 [Ectothiorhodospiraceae bacterium 2226]
MDELSEEDKRRIADAPKGTLVIMLLFAGAFTLAWLYFYFGVFLARGPVS